MEDLNQNKQLKMLFIIFIIVSIFHIIYASATYRGMYCDGALYMLNQLNWLSEGTYKIAFDTEHPRFCSMFITQLPIIIAHYIFLIKSKYVLMFIYSFFQFAIPFVSLYWSYTLAKRTKKPDIFFWNLLTYGGIVLLYQIFSVVESIPGISFHFILWNYLAAKMEYNKRDILGIIFLIVMMYGTYEYVAYLGIFFFLSNFYYVIKEKSVKNQLIKTIIGFGCLGASIFTIWYMLHAPGEHGEILRFLGEGVTVMPFISHLNIIITIAAIVVLIIFSFKKTQLKNYEIIAISIVFYLALRYLLTNLDISLVPMLEAHFRVITCFWIITIFLVIHLKDIIRPDYKIERWNNLICIAILCTIFQTLWQINNTYYWDKNIKYMKSELEKVKTPLYIASEHEEISSFFNKDLRRYIWHGIYATTSIIFSDTYEQKTLLVNYDKQKEDGNGIYRNQLYVYNKNKMSIPFGAFINIKNEYWDLTKCAKALDIYNKKKHIKTDF